MLRNVGVPDDAVGWAEVLFVFASTRLLTAVRFTPGGAGVVEALLIGGLVAAGGEHAEVAAAVLLFRVLTWLLPVPIGGLTYLAWRRQQARRSSPARDVSGRGRLTRALDHHPAVDPISQTVVDRAGWPPSCCSP